MLLRDSLLQVSYSFRHTKTKNRYRLAQKTTIRAITEIIIKRINSGKESQKTFRNLFLFATIRLIFKLNWIVFSIATIQQSHSFDVCILLSFVVFILSEIHLKNCLVTYNRRFYNFTDICDLILIIRSGIISW